MHRPDDKPVNINFSSGPCAKRPGWKFDILKNSSLGRSHRSSNSKEKLLNLILLTKEVLEIPPEYEVGIVPGSDTGAVEMAIWNCVGSRPIDIYVWDSFGNDWANDLSLELQLSNLTIIKSEYGKLPNLSCVNFDNDIMFNWNGTTSGVCIPNSRWISSDRKGLTICDATSAAFAMEIDWTKLDIATLSWQKCLGGEAAHGMIILSPKAIERLNSYIPCRPIPKLFQLKKNHKINLDIFNGSTINTPSMLCVEDFLDALNWAKGIGGLKELISRSKQNLDLVSNWVSSKSWIEFLCEDERNISSTSICLKFVRDNLMENNSDYEKKLEKFLVSFLENENIAYDIGSYRSAPSGLRIWGGPTIESSDIEKLLPWIDFAYEKACETI